MENLEVTILRESIKRWLKDGVDFLNDESLVRLAATLFFMNDPTNEYRWNKIMELKAVCAQNDDTIMS